MGTFFQTMNKNFFYTNILKHFITVQKMRVTLSDFFFALRINMTYTHAELQRMNSTTKWKGLIDLPLHFMETTTFCLYPTWNATVNGRRWAAIRSGRVITPELKIKYNLM